MGVKKFRELLILQNSYSDHSYAILRPPPRNPKNFLGITVWGLEVGSRLLEIFVYFFLVQDGLMNG